MSFKTGDRVAVYGVSRDETVKDIRGTVKEIHHKTGWLDVLPDFKQLHGLGSFDGLIPCHPKQCRILKKKKRRRVWVRFDGGNRPEGVTSTRPSPEWAGMGESIVEFIEVRTKK